jgi:hypothetical protein
LHRLNDSSLVELLSRLHGQRSILLLSRRELLVEKLVSKSVVLAHLTRLVRSGFIWLLAQFLTGEEVLSVLLKAH